MGGGGIPIIPVLKSPSTYHHILIFFPVSSHPLPIFSQLLASALPHRITTLLLIYNAEKFISQHSLKYALITSSSIPSRIFS